MKKTIFILTLLLTISINSSVFSNEVVHPKFECSIENIHNQIEIEATDVSIETININFAENGGSCTVEVSVSYNGVSATFSVTADTCEEAGAGAVQAAAGFVKQLRKLI